MKKLYEEVEALLKKDKRLVDENNEMNLTLVKDLSDKIDEKMIELLLSKDTIKDKFFLKVGNVLIFKNNDFKFFMDANKIDNSYTLYENKIGLRCGNRLLNDIDDVVLNFPYKDCVLEGGQSTEEGNDEYYEYNREKEKYDLKESPRKEIFFNEILAHDEIDRLFEPKAFTNIKKYTVKGEESIKEFTRNENGTIKDNLIIRGNNLLALHSLEKEFSGKIKLIYIDPPYNPDSAANTFSYNNSFNHSSWLSFIKNRVNEAKHLLSKDGLLCVAIDHNELFYLGVLCDEIFNRENRIGVIAVETNPGGRSDSEFFATSHEYFLVYAKDLHSAKINNLKLSKNELLVYNLEDEISKYKLVPLRRTGSNSTPDKRPNLCYPIFYDIKENKIYLEKKQELIEILPIGNDEIMRVWRWSKEKLKNSLKDVEVKKVKKSYAIFVKDRIRYEKKSKTLWYGSKYDASSHGTKLLQSLGLNGKFSYPKSLFLMKDIIDILTDKDAIVLDFHAGSGTTAHAVLELNKIDGGNRKFILVEQMDYIETVTVKRIQHIIKNNKSGSFVYLELAKWNEEAKEKIFKCKSLKELEDLLYELSEKYYLNYNVRLNDFQEKIIHEEPFKKLPLKKQQEMFIKMLDLNQLYINAGEMEDKKYELSKNDISLTKNFYNRIK